MKHPFRFHTLASIVLIVGVIISSIAVVPAAAVTDQERIAELQAQIEALEQQAAQYRSNIAGEQQKADSLRKQIAVLQNQIKGIEAEINATSKKISRTKLEISTVESRIIETEEHISRQKETIGRLVTFLNQKDQEGLLPILVKNESLTQFFGDLHDANQVSNQLVDVIGDLQEAKQTLEGDHQDLQVKKTDLEVYSRDQEIKRQSLASSVQAQSTLLTRTKGQEAQYQKMLQEIERKEAAFFNELRSIESGIIAGGLFIVHVTATKVPAKGTKWLRYPEEKVRLTQGYGMTAYARRGAYGGAGHNGIDVAVGYGTPVLASADGEIVANGTNDGFGNWVAIRHPAMYDMVTLYAHMSTFAPLRVGTQVKAGDVIGYEGATGNATGSHVHLSVYKDFFTYTKDNKPNQLFFNYFEGSVNPLNYL